jgi:hypothetical protein
MSTQVVIDGPDLDRRITEQIVRNTPAQRIYNASNEDIEAQVNGVTFLLKAESVTEIRDLMGVSNEERILARKQKRPANPRTRVVVTALEVVRHLISRRKLGQRGVVLLDNDGHDEERIRQAKQNATEFAYATAQATVNAYHAMTRAWHENPQNKGKYPPAMDDRQLRAQEVVDSHQAGALMKMRYPCPTGMCGYGTNDKDKMDLHMRVQHPLWRPDSAEALPATPKRRGRPPKVRTETPVEAPEAQ